MTQAHPLRVAILGCGQIADAHLQQIQRLPEASVVAVCDVHRDIADQAAARFDVPAAFDDLDQMLDEARPQVVHVTTPAQTHFDLSMSLLRRGCHVYVEKPFTLDVEECCTLLAEAEAAERLVTVGHDQLFDPTWLECRRRVDAGEIGAVRHVESVLGYPLGGQFGTLVATDPQHWVHRLPGGLFHNTLSHPLYRITDLLVDESLEIDAHWFSRTGGFPTDLRAHFRSGAATASLSFDTAIEPQRVTRIYGERGLLEVDLDAQVIRRQSRPRLPGAFGKLETPFHQWREASRNLRRNLWRFVRSDIHYFGGMHELFRRFYSAIRNEAAPPIPYREIRRVTSLMDQIFDQCRARDAAASRNDSRSSMAASTATNETTGEPTRRRSTTGRKAQCTLQESTER